MSAFEIEPVSAEQPCSLSSALKSARFLVFLSINFCVYSLGWLHALTEKELLLIALDKDSLSTLVLTLSGLSSSLGKLFFGYLFDKVSFRWLFQVLLLCTGIC